MRIDTHLSELKFSELGHLIFTQCWIVNLGPHMLIDVATYGLAQKLVQAVRMGYSFGGVRFRLQGSRETFQASQISVVGLLQGAGQQNIKRRKWNVQ